MTEAEIQAEPCLKCGARASERCFAISIVGHRKKKNPQSHAARVNVAISRKLAKAAADHSEGGKA